MSTKTTEEAIEDGRVGKLIYALNVSLDGFIETPDHSLDWTIVDDELHTWFNDQERTFDASLYGRRLYEVMNAFRPTGDTNPASTQPMREYARIWKATPKIVFSSSLGSVEGNARLARGDIEEELARVRSEFSGDLNVGGATLAGSFIRRGLVDEFRLIVHPVVIGGGTPFFPPDTPLRLTLLETHTFTSGVQYVRYGRA